MFVLPSLWNLIISTLVFILVAKYFRIYLEGKGLAKGMARGTLVFAVAYLLSWGSAEIVDWTEAKISVPLPATQNPDYLQKILDIVAKPLISETKE